MQEVLFYNVKEIGIPVGAVLIGEIMWDVIPQSLVNKYNGGTVVILRSHADKQTIRVEGFENIGMKQVQASYDENDLLITLIESVSI